MLFLLRPLAAFLAGVFVIFVLLLGVEVLSNLVLHPFPSDFRGTHEEICVHVAKYPPLALAVVVGAWGGIACFGTWLSGWIGNIYSAGLVGILFTAMVALNISMLPYALWFEIAIMLAVPMSAIAGTMLGPRSAEPQSSPG